MAALLEEKEEALLFVCNIMEVKKDRGRKGGMREREREREKGRGMREG